MNKAFDTRIVILILSLLHGLAGLRLVKVTVPAYKLRGESTFLECLFELNRTGDGVGGDKLIQHYQHKNNNNYGNMNYLDVDSGDITSMYRRARNQQHKHQPQQQYQQQRQQQYQQHKTHSSTHRIHDESSRLRGHQIQYGGTADAYGRAGAASSSITDSESNEQIEDGEALYAVKWYKDNEEFYRFVPKANPQKQSYRVDGIRVIDEHSDSTRVLLRGLTLNSTGLYRCEVSAEAPNFSSAQGEGRMDIVYLPRDGPHIRGQQFQYQIGDTLNLNCSSGKSHPASHLQWFINDEPLVHLDSLIRYNKTVHKHGLITSTLGLEMIVDGRHFFDGEMRVKCLASISPVLWKGGKESVLQRRPGIIDNREAMLLVRSSTTIYIQNWIRLTIAALLGKTCQLLHRVELS